MQGALTVRVAGFIMLFAKMFSAAVPVRRLGVLVAVAVGVAAMPARAAEDAFEFWMNPSARYWVDDNTNFRLETAQRFRRERDGRADTYFGRLWVGQRLNEHVSVEFGVEKRINDGDHDETRLLQQVLTRHGILRNRIRMEERFVQNQPQMGLRLRTDHGVFVPLDRKERLNLRAEAEFFFTLRPTRPGTMTGLTELRTQLGLAYQVNDRINIGLTYMRQQRFKIARADSVGHAPLLSFEYSFGRVPRQP